MITSGKSSSSASVRTVPRSSVRTYRSCTTAVRGSLPRRQQGVASALNDTSREMGGAVGIALLGSIFNAQYSANIGDGSEDEIVVTHNLGTRDVQVQVYRATSPYDQVLVDNERTDTNNVLLRFNIAPTTNQFRVVVVG